MRFGQVGSGDVLGWWAAEPFQTTDGRLWIGVGAFAPSGVDSVRFLVSGIGATSIAASERHSARGVRAYWISLEPSQVSGDSVSVTATVIPNGTEQPLESPPEQIRKRGARWDVETFKDGWTYLKPSPDSRLIYVSNAGNDASAASAKGRGYYLPSDPEIGPDPTNPVGPIVAYRNPQRGLMKLPGGPRSDWVMFRRGETFVPAELFDPTIQYTYQTLGFIPPSIGQLFCYWWNASMNRFERDDYTKVPQGRSESERYVITAWGPPSDARPKFATGGFDASGHWSTSGAVLRNSAVVSLDIGGINLGLVASAATGRKENVLVEDCIMRGFAAQGGPITLRRCTVSGMFNASDHNQGFFIRGELGSEERVTVEECVFDRNGYKENPEDATTWTAGVVSTGSIGALPVGTGVQPTRTYYDRNIYVSTGDGVNHAQVTLRGNIFSRGGGGGSVQMRQGGVADRNLFMWNEDAGFNQGGAGGIYKDNVILHDDHMLPPGGWGKACGMWNGDSTSSGLRYVMDGNIAAHFHRGNNGQPGFYSRETQDASTNALLSGSFWILNNTMYRSTGSRGISIERNTPESVTVSGNEIAVLSGGVIGGSLTSTTGTPYQIDGNLYHSQSATPFGSNQTFAQWQAIRPDLDDQSQFLSDFAAFKTAAGWTAPERDIVSYMQSVDPTYVVNEDVYVDEESTVKQAVRQRVWEVLSDSSKTGNLVMSVDRAKQAARRYHAFITFIQRAKQNRKGAWDTRWTAEAVNNYIREGFGKGD